METAQPFDMWQQWAQQWSQWSRAAGATPGTDQPWSQLLQQFQNMAAADTQPSALGAGAAPAPAPVRIDPDELRQLQENYVKEATELWNNALESSTALTDRRFSGEAWAGNPLASFSAALYLLNTRTLMTLTGAAESDPKTKARLMFAVEQWAAASSPSNFLAFNVEAQKKAVETRGASLVKGMENLLADLRRGHVSMTDEDVFEVGRNVATTEGAVVFENELFQLIEYKPTTATVRERPIVMVPPCINKYYILDLQAKNSFIRHSVDSGNRTFVVSWCNPDESLSQKTWDDYIEDGVLKAIASARAIADSDQVNTLGFCIGGTMLSNALAVLAARHEATVASATFLTTMIDFSDTGVLDVFIDEPSVRFREMQMGQGGILPGRDLASTFSFLRPNDLVWNYVVGNYLKGETPPPFDLLYWNSDSTNLPGPFYTWYLRHTYLQNDMIKPNKLTVCGEKLNLRKIKVPSYIYGSREDHIVPITAAYASTQVLAGPKRFVMGASGHIAGVINPPAANKRSHWTREDGQFPPTREEWLEGAREHAGSWWNDWARWLERQSGKLVAAPKRYGRGRKYAVIEPAPGRYVKVRA